MTQTRIISFCFVVIILFWGVQSVFGQTAAPKTETILTWQANNYYPADYAGKAYATPNTPISVALELLINKKLQDLSSAEFIWYVDQEFLNSGKGLKETSFVVSRDDGQELFVRVVMQFNGERYETSTRVPVKPHTVVIDSPYPNQVVKSDSRLLFEIIPYFFNVISLSDLTFFWDVNGKKDQSDGNNQLAINIGASDSEKAILVSGTAQNKKKLLEFSNDKKRLVVY